MVTLKLFFFGLMAFVVHGPDIDKPRDVEVLLLDARRPPMATDGCPIHSHIPALYFAVQSTAQCPGPCRVAHGLCRCELDREEILLPEHIGEHSRCRQDDDCDDEAFKLVPKLAVSARERFFGSSESLRRKIETECLSAVHQASHVAGHGPDPPCPLVAGRLVFIQDQLHVCQLAHQTIDAKGRFRAPGYRFLPVTERKSRLVRKIRRVRQSLSSIFTPNNSSNPGPTFLQRPQPPVAEIMYMETNVKVDGQGPVNLTIEAFDGSESYQVTLPRSTAKPCLGRTAELCYDLVIANEAVVGSHGHAYGRCTHTTARDFELYHDLSQSPNRLFAREVPREEAGEGEELQDQTRPDVCLSTVLENFLGRRERSATSRAVCPQVAFSTP